MIYYVLNSVHGLLNDYPTFILYISKVYIFFLIKLLYAYAFSNRQTTENGFYIRTLYI